MSWKAGLSIMKRSTSVAASMVAERRFAGEEGHLAEELPFHEARDLAVGAAHALRDQHLSLIDDEEAVTGVPSSITRSPAA
jgi:hypothetical protein